MITFLIAGLFGIMLTGIPVAFAMLVIGGGYLIWQDMPLMLIPQFMTLDSRVLLAGVI